jgi:plasmid stabilization system protein ParE
MTFEIWLRLEAEQDLSDAAVWYEERLAGLGHQFLDEALAAFTSIAEAPLRYLVVHRNTRRALIHRFPFGIYYRVETDTIVVIAVMHGSRDPHRWKTRT